ncbi:NAD-dependent epimerase/dehydratase family protein [Corynebacterium senegalense]|uniref:NAD-dependent epimerase/dehydratase family protein n=1 Tax=Corynebacterium senegalense TaxID=2080750 RepID=UPI000E205027|nr:NAD-dependent epimerase/dehydratase family protein [Corynebacterium senegalense]
MPINALVIGAGPVGRATAAHLASLGHEVAVLTRSGTPVGDLRALNGDAGREEDLRRALREFPATHIINCMHAPYTERHWREALLPAEGVILREAAQRGLHVTFPESVYAFGSAEREVSGASVPVARRGKPGVRAELLRRRDRSGATTCSVVASDYYGPGSGPGAVAHVLVLDRIAAGRRPLALFSRNTPHAYTYLPDFARALAEAAVHGATGIAVTPTAPPVSQADFAREAADVLGVAFRSPLVLGGATLRAAGLFDRNVGGIAEMKWLWTTPQSLRGTFAWEPTALEEGLRRAVGG